MAITTTIEPSVAEATKEEPSILALRNAVPKHCFHPTLFWSFAYLLRDLTYSGTLILALIYTLPFVNNSPILLYTTLNIYAFTQGLIWTGLWIIAHDAGHGAFSKYPRLNDAVGCLLHSALLAPYFPWKASHHRHHIYANHIEKDSIYVPPRRAEYARRLGVAVEKLDEVLEGDSPVMQLGRIVLQQVVGWNWYILSNITCPSTAVANPNMSFWRYSHFDPWGGLFAPNETLGVILSDLGCLTTVVSLYILNQHLGDFRLTLWGYIIPWCWLNHWITMITFLQHTHPSLPKYAASSWTFVRGALATMDRDFGVVGRHFFHHITSDHVTHHLFPGIPHYHAAEATRAIVPVLGARYAGKGTFGFGDLTEAFGCQWVDGDVERDRAEGEKAPALWYRGGPSPPVEIIQRGAKLASAL